MPAFTGNVFRLAASFLLSKYVATFHGPAGVALLGQFTNLNGILQSLSTGSIDNGVVRYVAETRRAGPARLTMVLSASAQIIGVLSCATMLGVLLLSGRLAGNVFYSADYTGLVILMSVLALGQGAFSWASGVLNGLGRLGTLGLVNIIGAAGTITVVCVAVFTGQVKHQHLLAGLALANLPAVGYAFWQLTRSWSDLAPLRLHRWPMQAYTQFIRYSVMSGAAALIVPLTAMAVRGLLVQHGGLEQAGIYEGVTRLSTAYLSLITTTLGMYYLPRMSGATQDGQRQEMRTMLRLVAPGVMLLGLVVWVLRDPLFTLVYSRDFTVSGRLMLVQVAGDCFKMSSWVLAYQMIARGMVGTFLLTEMSSAALRVASAAWLIPLLGPEGAVASYTVTSAAYLLVMLWIFREQFKPHNDRPA